MTGAPLIGGVAPAVIVVSAAKVTRVGMPRVIFTRGGIPVPVARGGGPPTRGAVVVTAPGRTGVGVDPMTGVVTGGAAGVEAVVCGGTAGAAGVVVDVGVA